MTENGMSNAVRQALAIDRSSPAAARTVDITTTGARTGQPRRIEIWFYRAGGSIYITGLPGGRSWYANLLANPAFTFHLKNGLQADLPATARAVTDDAERRKVFAEIIDDLNSPGPKLFGADLDLEKWVAGSPLVEVGFQPAS